MTFCSTLTMMTHSTLFWHCHDILLYPNNDNTFFSTWSLTDDILLCIENDVTTSWSALALAYDTLPLNRQRQHIDFGCAALCWQWQTFDPPLTWAKHILLPKDERNIYLTFEAIAYNRACNCRDMSPELTSSRSGSWDAVVLFQMRHLLTTLPGRSKRQTADFRTILHRLKSPETSYMQFLETSYCGLDSTSEG